MDADDPRHGKHAGYMAHYADGETPCDPCRDAHRRAEKRRVLDHARNKPRRTSGLGTARRIQALIAIGWTMTELAARIGFAPQNLQRLARYGDKQVRVVTADRIDQLFSELCLTRPPERNQRERWSASMSRGFAKRNGWVTAAAWDDIDLDEAPHRGDDTTGPGHGHVDDARVIRILNGDFSLAREATNAERHIIVAAWPGPLADLERMAGWKPERYIDRGAA